MRHLIILLTGAFFLLSCGQGNNKQKELPLNKEDSGTSIVDSNKNTNQEISKISQDNHTDNNITSLNLDGEWKDCKGKMGSITLTKTQDGFLLKPNSTNMSGDVNLKKEKDGYYVDPVLGFVLKYDKQKKHLLYDAGFGDINGTVWIEYCKTVVESNIISESQIEDPLDINLEGKWKDCDGMSYGFKLTKKGTSYSMQSIKGFFVPIECDFKKKGNLYTGCGGDAEIRYDKLKKRLIYWDAGGNDAEYCRIE